MARATSSLDPLSSPHSTRRVPEIHANTGDEANIVAGREEILGIALLRLHSSRGS